MPVDIKHMSGIMNLDLQNDVMPPFHHKFLMNGRFRGVGGNMRLENVPGNVLVPNYLLPSGTNQCIGAFYDSVKRRIIWFNYNSNGRNGIYQYSVETKAISKIFLCFTDSADDILNFSLDLPVHSSVIIYRPQSDGDLLYWTDGQFGDGNRPRGFNIDTVSTLAPFTEDMINAGKNAPLNPPTCSYQDDPNVTVNNMRKQLFQFSYRPVYKNLEKGTVSPFSKLALPVDFSDIDTQNDPTKNAYIQVGFNTGASDFQSIEIYGRTCEGKVYGDWFFITNLNRDDYNFLPATNYTFNFYNDSVYSTQLFSNAELTYSYLPDIANTMESLKGNVLIYGGITDGYDAILRGDTNMSVTSGLSTLNSPTISYYQTNPGTIFVVIGSVITTGVVYHIQFDYVSSSVPGSVNINYTTLVTDNQTDVTVAIAALLNSVPVDATITSPGTIEASISGTGPLITNVIVNTSSPGIENASASWKWDCSERLGIIYFDDRGKTNGVISWLPNSIDTNNAAANTPYFSVITNIIQIPFIAASINSLPPDWAVSFQWVRAILTPKFLQWITNDYQTDSDYIYFCIQNLYYTQQKSNGFVPTYDFSKGDRIKVMAKFSGGVYTPYSVQLDMEVVGLVDRTMTSPASVGKFIKVAKPTTFPSVAYSSNMLIELYTPIVRTADNLQLFYEWGEKYGVSTNPVLILTYTLFFGTFQVGETIIEAVTNATGVVESVSPTELQITSIVGTFQNNLTFTGLTSGAAGTITAITQGTAHRYHDGQITNQTANQPATFQWFDGDVYFKSRTFYLNVGDTAATSAFMMDANFNDYFSSEVNSNGRGWPIIPDAATIYNPVQVRWGGQYQQDTNINDLPIFQPLDFDTIDRAKGDICRLLTEESLLYSYQQHGVGSFGIYSKYIQNNEGQVQLVTTDEIITRNNINYLQGNYGLGNQPCALWRGKGESHYFIDDTRGDQLRRSGDGVDNLSEIYDGQYYLRNLISKYNSPYLRPDGSKAKIIGFFDYFENNSQCILQEGTYFGKLIGDYNFSFHNGNDPVKGFRSFYSYFPDWALQAEDVTFSWKNGQLYIHNDEIKRNFFYNVQYPTSITLVFNKDVGIKKVFDAIAYQGNKVWVSPLEGDVLTSMINPQTGLPQVSKIREFDYDLQDNIRYAAFNRDMNSMADKRLALCEGDYLNGNDIQVTLVYSGSSYGFLYLPYVNYQVNPRNF